MSRTFPLLQNIEREKKKRGLRTSFFIEQNEAQRYSFLLLPKTTKQSETYKNTRKGRLNLRSLHAQTKHNLSNIHSSLLLQFNPVTVFELLYHKCWNTFVILYTYDYKNSICLRVLFIGKFNWRVFFFSKMFSSISRKGTRWACARTLAATKNFRWGKVSAARVHASVSVTHVRTETERSVCFLLRCRTALPRMATFPFGVEHCDPFTHGIPLCITVLRVIGETIRRNNPDS